MCTVFWYIHKVVQASLLISEYFHCSQGKSHAYYFSLPIPPTWLWYIILFIYSKIWFASILLKIFASIFIKYISLQFSYFFVCFFGIRVTEWIGMYSLLFFFWEEFMILLHGQVGFILGMQAWLNIIKSMQHVNRINDRNHMHIHIYEEKNWQNPFMT